MPDVTVAAGKMAAHNVVLVANQVSTITFTDNVDAVDIISDGAASVYYTIDGTTPTVGGSNSLVLPAGTAALDTRYTLSTVDRVKLISVGTPTVSVQRGN